MIMVFIIFLANSKMQERFKFWEKEKQLSGENYITIYKLYNVFGKKIQKALL